VRPRYFRRREITRLIQVLEYPANQIVVSDNFRPRQCRQCTFILNFASRYFQIQLLVPLQVTGSPEGHLHGGLRRAPAWHTANLVAARVGDRRTATARGAADERPGAIAVVHVYGRWRRYRLRPGIALVYSSGGAGDRRDCCGTAGDDCALATCERSAEICTCCVRRRGERDTCPDGYAASESNAA